MEVTWWENGPDISLTMTRLSDKYVIKSPNFHRISISSGSSVSSPAFLSFHVILSMPLDQPIFRESIQYWDTFYENQHVREPSPFAEFVRANYLQSGRSLLEFGCGNGRDAEYLDRCGLNVTGVDLSETAIQQCIEEIPGGTFIVGDFSELPHPHPFHYVYSRFTLHAVDEPTENRALAGAYEHLKPKGLLFIEVRTILDELCGKGERISDKEWIHDGHYRRFIIPERILGRARKAGFSPEFIHLSRGLARWGDQDPAVLRLVLRRD
jgi:SAM-dependent methyltransferase